MLSKRLSLIVVVLFASYALKEQKQKNVITFPLDNEPKPIALSGKVKEITITQDFAGNPNPGQDFDIISISKAGNISEIIHGFHGATLHLMYTTKYDLNHKKEELKEYLVIPKRNYDKLKDSIDINDKKYFNKDSVRILVSIYRYDKNSQISKHIITIMDNSGPEDFLYNEVGDLVEYNTDPTHTGKTIYRYDKQHHLLQSDHYNDDKRIKEIKYEYQTFDSHNNWTKVIARSTSVFEGSGVRLRTITRKISYY